MNYPINTISYGCDRAHFYVTGMINNKPKRLWMGGDWRKLMEKKYKIGARRASIKIVG
jgi:hypothetical protein